ncbi:amidohydrolase family protein [Cryptosporangium minutisporangium]|uniref:amidohydrolase family protein n=1 Tax=Cryptosporangium minutisporangium TaxID=113569 RepID=UPI0031F05985
MAPLTDAGLRDFCDELGIPGFVDAHVHFMPERVLHKVWAYFDALPASVGLEWPIEYRLAEAARLELLGELGVIVHTALLYPHKPAMATWLNEWALQFARDVPNCVPTGTFFPEPGAADYVRAGIEGGLRAFKAHLQVGAYDPTDPQLDAVWGQLAEAGIPIVCHCGSGPLPGPYTGPGPISAVLARHPTLTLVVAHLGSPEYAEFLALADAYPNVHLDTTMTFTDFTERMAPFPPDLRPRLRDLGDRIVLGSDYPNIPYPYAHQVESLVRLDLGDDWLRGVLHDNGARLLRASSSSATS